MKITIVGNRSGQAVVYWPGVVLASLVIVILYGLGVAGLSWALGWFSLRSFAALPIVLSAVIGLGIKRGLNVPPQELPRIGGTVA